jgi:hypothetical protein
MSTLLRGAAAVLVSVYMIAVGLWLLATRRLPAQPLRAYLRTLARRRRRGTLDAPWHDGGHCWVARVDPRLPSAAEGISRLQLREDDRVLGPADALHDDIRAHGGGRFSHWAGHVYFSASDNSDPRTNGRVYRWHEV